MTFTEIAKLVSGDCDIVVVNVNSKDREIQTTIKHGIEKNARKDFVRYFEQKEVTYITAVNYRTLEVGVKL